MSNTREEKPFGGEGVSFHFTSGKAGGTGRDRAPSPGSAAGDNVLFPATQPHVL